MSGSNYRRNAAAIDQFRKELEAELGEISEIDKKILNQAVNEGIRKIKQETPVGLHPNPVTFTVKVVVNHTEYATYWNYGHRITNKKGGPTKGFVKGTYVLEKGITYIDRRLMELFKAEIERIRRKYDE